MSRAGHFIPPTLTIAIVLLMALMGGTAAAVDHPQSGYDQETLRRGEKIYRQGILPSGEILRGYIRGDITIDSSAFSCESCHMRSGLGSIEGGVSTPPTNGSKLFQPYFKGTILTTSTRSPRNNYVINPARRPAYTDETLADALRYGINPAGKELASVMPRYLLEDQDLAILLYYLKWLSAEASPGVDNTTMRLATIISEDVSPEDRKAMLEPLENFVALKNSQAKVYAARTKYMGGGGFPEELNLAYRKLSLARWELKGPPETWQQQLAEYYRQEPVFAFIGGMTSGDWQPVHDFCEKNGIPSLFPFTDFPVISESDWYTLYFSKGFYQEGAAAALFLARTHDTSTGQVVVQVVRNSREGRALSTGFSETWQQLGNSPPLTFTLAENEPVSPDLLLRLTAVHKPAAIMLWTGAEVLPALSALADRPQTVLSVFVSSGYLKNALWNIPATARNLTYLTYPYRLSGENSPSPPLPSPARTVTATGSDARIAGKARAIVEILQLGLMHMNRNFYRDNLLDVISMLPDQTTPDYERLSFGPGQRYGSKGCYIVQLSPGPVPSLEKKSDWVIH